MESPAFTRLRPLYLDDDEYVELQNCLVVEPLLGVLVPGSGGVRKLRWGTRGSGKRGGLRVIYFFRREAGEIWMLTLYAKSQTTNIPAHILKRLLEAFAHE